MALNISSSRSTSPSSSGVSESPPRLDPSTLAILDSFLFSKAEEERRLNELAEQAAARTANLALDSHINEDDPPMMSVDEYRLAFGLSIRAYTICSIIAPRYSTKFATHLARSIRQLCEPDSIVAFVCCPTAFVAFQHTNPLEGARLLEYDQRFSILAPKKFIAYDLNKPEFLPEDLRETVDIVVADPPFLNEATNQKIIRTVSRILRPKQGKLILLTSSSVEKILHQLYNKPPIGPLRRTSLDPEHNGLANEFACWGSWDGAEDFGKDD